MNTALFTPLRLGPCRLPNRIVMAPMTRNRAGAGNVPMPLMATYYAQRASAGLIISEATQVAPEGVGYPHTPGIHTPEQVAGWKNVTGAVHAAGGRIFLQLWHVGRISHTSLQPHGAPPVAPSAIAAAGNATTLDGPKPFETPRALERAEIPGVVEQYRRGARGALDAGFDGVEIHGANGYLIDQFLRDGTNHRTDDYGGSVENRARFLLEVADAVIGIWGADRVGVRLSPGGAFNDMKDSDPIQTFSYAMQALDRLEIAYVHLREGTADDVTHGGMIIPARTFRPYFSGALIANDGYDATRAEAALTGGNADLIAFGSPYISNPDLPERIKAQAPLTPPNFSTVYGGDAAGYTDYPALTT